MRIQNTLFFANMATCALLVSVMFVLMQWSVDRGLLAYINTREAAQWQSSTEELARYYQENGSWQELKNNRRAFHAIVKQKNYDDLRPRLHPRDIKSHLPPPPPRRHDGRVAPPLLLSDTLGNIVVGRQRRNTDYQQRAITLDSEIVGYLLLPKRQEITEDFELNFLSQQRETFIVISLIVLVISAFSSFIIARRIVSPIRRLAATMNQLTHGEYQPLENHCRKDELGELSRDLNLLSKTLQKNDSARKQWLADTSHELRTPIAIVRGELEAMLDGVRVLDKKHIRSALQETLHLGKLIDDLYELSNSDIGAMRYRMGKVDLVELLRDIAEQHRTLLNENNLDLTLALPAHAIEIWGDDTRLNQLISNILSNCIKYTDSDGRVYIHLSQNHSQVQLTIEDSSPGVTDTDLPQLFDHLFRVESSRNRKTGGAGLGLAICLRIAEAHQYQLRAGHSSLGGLAITLHIPIT